MVAYMKALNRGELVAGFALGLPMAPVGAYAKAVGQG